MKLRSIILVASLLLLPACKRESVSIGDTDLGSQTLKQVLPGEGPVETDDHGTELWFAVGALTGAAGINANGVAQAHYLEDGSFIATVQLNIERAPEGSFYEAWIMPENKEDWVSLGHLRTPFGDVRHSLKYLEKKDLQGYTKIVVTLEADDGNPLHSEAIAEGILKVRER